MKKPEEKNDDRIEEPILKKFLNQKTQKQKLLIKFDFGGRVMSRNKDFFVFDPITVQNLLM